MGVLGDILYLLGEFSDFVWKLRDKKVDGWFLCDSVIPTLLFSGVYVLCVTCWGPTLMTNRKAYDMQKCFVGFNFAVVIINVILHYQFMSAGWGVGYRFVCEKLDYSVTEKSLKMAVVCWWFYLTKYVDCIYTIFNVLKKKFYKISLQHVIHHSTMIINAWILVRFCPGGYVTFTALVNTLTHCILYLYYAMSNMYPSSPYRKLFSTITKWANLLELFVICIYLLLPYFFDCSYSVIVTVYTFFMTFVYILLFIHGILLKPHTHNTNVNFKNYDKLIAFDMSDI